MSRNSIQVCIKLRPLLPKERDASCLWTVKNNSLHMVDSHAEPYVFDFIFDQEDNNQIIFEKMAKQIVCACVQGFNGTIFAYGQTSSGKTYTMMGDEQNPGVMVLAAKEIFKQIEQSVDRQFLIRVGYIEIYNEKIYDLLNKKNQDLKIHETTTGIVSVNCEENIITSEEDLLNYLCIGNKERTVSETNMNERSSRSHAIFRIIIESRKTDRSEDAVIQSVLNLVDLAGSERADQTGARGARLKEGGHINKSLLFLSNVIKRLSEEEDHKYISYRDSKLTRILQASLGGNALTSIICTIKPTTIEETQSTLNFAMRAKIIKNKPQVNEIVSDATMMKRLEHEIKDLKSRLDEERRKNESQLKVGQLEQRIKNDMLKIISCNSINLREKRRRTWCSASSVESNVLPSNLPVPISGSSLQLSQLPKPKFFTKHITTRDNAPKTVSVFKSVEIPEEENIDEEFKPAELHNFGTSLSPCRTPQTAHLKVNRAEQSIRLSITPTKEQLGAKILETVEQDLLELQMFTNLENKISVQHEHYNATKEKLELVSNERDQLLKEKWLYMQMKDELVDTKQSLAEAGKRCEQLEIKVSKQVNAKELLNAQIGEYEQQLKALKETNKQLEMENRDAVNLQFEFDRLRNKSQLRETELVTALNEKNTEIVKLQQSFDTFAEDTLRNSKELQLREKIACKEATANINRCVKCVDLQRLLEENKQVTAAFEKLTLEYEKLQLSLKQMSSDAARAQLKLDELEQTKSAEAAECDALRQEIGQIRAKLVEVQTAYEQMNCDRNQKTETCAQLDSIVATAKLAMQLLQTKYDKLELSWQQQQYAIKDIQSKYDAIQLKYDSLQAEYDQLLLSQGDTRTLYERLQFENKNLQTEIAQLKTRVEEAQRDLLEDRSHSSENAELKTCNEQLKLDLAELQKQFKCLQDEYDDLSNQLLDSIQESDGLREKFEKLKQEISLQQQSQSAQLKAHVSSDSSSQCSDVDSMKSSGVCTESSEPDIDTELLQRFQQLTATLREVEFASDDGRLRVFRAKESNERTAPALKLFIQHSQEIVETGTGCNNSTNGARVCMQGMLKQNRFHIVEIDADDDDQKELQTYIAELEQAVDEKNMLLEATERTIKEMSEQMTHLESALLEKSVIVEKVEGYQRQIVSLEEENAKITTVCEELQEKVRECTMNESLMVDLDTEEANDTLSCSQGTFTESLEIEKLKAQKLTLESELSTLKAAFDMEKAELQQKSETIAQLQREIGAMAAASSEFEEQQSALQTQLKEHEAAHSSDKELIGSLRAEMSDMKDKLDANTVLIAELEAHLQEAKVQLNLQKQASLVGMDSALAELKATYAKELATLETNLEAARSELSINEKKYKDEVNRLHLELYEKLELSESEYRNNMQKYNRDWERSKETYEKQLADLEVKLAKRIEQQEKQAAAANLALEKCKDEHDKAVTQLKQEKHELESTNEGNKKLLEKLHEQLSESEQYMAANGELREAAEKLKAECQTLKANEKQSAHAHAANVSELQQEMCKLRDTHTQQLATYADLKTESDAKLEALKQEKLQLEIELRQCRQKADDLCVQLAKSAEHLDGAVGARKTQLEDYERLAKQHDEVMSEMTALKAAFEQQQDEYKKTKATAEERAAVLEQKIDALKPELHSAQLKAAHFEQQAYVEQLLSAAQISKTEDQEVTLVQIRETLGAVCAREQLLNKKCQVLTGQLAAEQRERQQCSKNAESAISELQLKYKTLQADKTKLEIMNGALAAQVEAANEKCKGCIALGEQLANLKLEHVDCEHKHAQLQTAYKALEERMVSTVEEAGRCSKVAQEELSQTKQMLAESDANYRKLMQKKEAAYKETKVKLEATVSCLLSEKKKHEDKFAELEQLTKRLELDLLASQQRKSDSNANLSVESNASTSSPTTRKSLDRMLGEHIQLKAINVNIEDKLHKKQHQKTSQLESEVRRNRRLSTHDERRRQSYWGATRDVGLMTDPLDINCKCVELSAKLEDCEKSLYLREGQVKNLHMELKNHPLKDENALLKKRLQEEQDKSCTDMKRLKQKNHDLLEKINVLTAEQQGALKHVANQSLSPRVPPKIVANAETQTDGTGNDCLQKLQSQYHDLMQICRFRYNLIKELEQKIKEKENAGDSSNVTSLEMGQISSLKAKVVSLEKELSVTKYKLDHAKAALMVRRKRIEELEAEVANSGNSRDSPI